MERIAALEVLIGSKFDRTYVVPMLQLLSRGKKIFANFITLLRVIFGLAVVPFKVFYYSPGLMVRAEAFCFFLGMTVCASKLSPFAVCLFKE